MKSEERIVEVMGTTAHVIVTGGRSGLVDRAVERLEELEARWSRFRSTSEISRLNDRPGVPVLVSNDTSTLIERALEGWRLTEGRFDPTLLREVRATGCAGPSSSSVRVMHRVAMPRPPGMRTASLAARRSSGRRADPAPPIVGTVWLGPEVQVDQGGIGKGLAADLVVDLLLAEGALGALVNVGGDLRAASRPRGRRVDRCD